MVKMSQKAFVKEHKDLLKVLKSGSKKGLRKEYKEQSQELKRVTKRAKRTRA